MINEKKMTVVEYTYWITERALKALDTVNIQLTGRFQYKEKNGYTVKLFEVVGKKVYY